MGWSGRGDECIIHRRKCPGLLYGFFTFFFMHTRTHIRGAIIPSSEIFFRGKRTVFFRKGKFFAGWCSCIFMSVNNRERNGLVIKRGRRKGGR